MDNEFTPIQEDRIIFPASDATGQFTLYTNGLMQSWNKTALKKLIMNEIVNNVWIPSQIKPLILQRLEQRLMSEHMTCVEMYNTFGVKKYDRMAKTALDLAEICRLYGRDKEVCYY